MQTYKYVFLVDLWIIKGDGKCEDDFVQYDSPEKKGSTTRLFKMRVKKMNRANTIVLVN